MPHSPRPARTDSKGRRLPHLLALALTALSCGEPPPTGERPPHVLLVSIDTLRADHLGCYGYVRDTSPRIDRLAREGVLFEECTSTTSWTLPAHLSMLTGLPVSAHGVCDDRLFSRPAPDGGALPVPLRGVFLPELLRGAGYRTAGFYTWKFLEPIFGFGPGFEVYERLGHTFFSYPPVARRFEELRAANDRAGLEALAAEYPELFDSTRPSSPETVERAIEWIDGARRETPDRPYFCFVHLFDVHDPYTPPAPFDSRFTDPDYDGPIDGRNVMSANSAVRADMPARDLDQLVALYDGGIAYVDAQLGRLLDALEERGLLDDTLVVVTSDHGEEFFEHGNKTHRHSLHRESVHVPLVMRWPAGLAAGRRVQAPVGLVDLAPTLGALCAVGAPPGAGGRDLSDVATGRAQLEPATYLSELYLFDDGPAPRRLVGLRREGEHDLLETRGLEPWQVQRVTGGADPQGRTVLARLAAERERIEAARPRTPVRLAGPDGGLDAGDLVELSVMGYAGGDEPPEGAAEEGDDPGRLCVDGCVWPDGE